MYRELVLELTKGNEWVKVQPPCSETVISEAEKVVGYSFPEELKNLLREMNGDKWLFLSAEEIIENVKLNREIFLPLLRKIIAKKNIRNEWIGSYSSQRMGAVIIIVTVFAQMGRLIRA